MAKPKKKRIEAKAAASADEIAVYATLYLRALDAVNRMKRSMDVVVKEMKTKHVSPKEIIAAFKDIETSAIERQSAASRKVAYLQALGAPVQLEMFDMAMPMPNDIIARAEEKGRMDAIRGLGEVDNAWNAGTPEGQAWLLGHRKLLDLVAAYERRFEAPDDEPPGPAADFQVDGYDSTVTLHPKEGEIVPVTDNLVDALRDKFNADAAETAAA